jgi:hypothetical protein
VTQGEAPEEVHYFNIELETHDCVLAEGIWSETYADCLDLRARFHNAAQFEALYPGQKAPAEPQLCAPRPEAGRVFEAALRPVLHRAEAQVCQGTLRGYVECQEGVLAGWAVDMAHPELMPRLEILLDGQVIADCVAHVARDDVRAAGYGAGRCGFSWAIPEGVRGERLEVRRVGDASLLQRVHELAVLAA